jgi:hypothetical protein
MSFFNKMSNSAGRLFNKATSKGGIFDKVNVALRKGDNTVQRVGAFIRPIADQFGLGDVVGGAVNKFSALATRGRDLNRDIRNNLERAVKAPMSELQNNYA